MKNSSVEIYINELQTTLLKNLFNFIVSSGGGGGGIYSETPCTS